MAEGALPARGFDSAGGRAVRGCIVNRRVYKDHFELDLAIGVEDCDGHHSRALVEQETATLRRQLSRQGCVLLQRERLNPEDRHPKAEDHLGWMNVQQLAVLPCRCFPSHSVVKATVKLGNVVDVVLRRDEDDRIQACELKCVRTFEGRGFVKILPAADTEQLCHRWVLGKCSGDGCKFRHAVWDSEQDKVGSLRREQHAQRCRSLQRDGVELNAMGDAEAHSGAEPHSKRAEVFARWLVRQYGIESLNRGAGVLDVAGGKGMLSYELGVLGIKSTVIDPNPRELPKSRNRVVALDKVSECFDAEFVRTNLEFIRSVSVVVALHPDEATEPVVDLSLATEIPFAVVPCCVFANQHPERVGPDGRAVRSIVEFLDFLQHKGEHIRVAKLDFSGRNTCLFTLPQRARSPGHTRHESPREHGHRGEAALGNIDGSPHES
eukprot:TRINITY_DN12399_c0_g1_i3.p1 TRINITY_DN12399_c0_g1~~TRINITY_DN12399_c0_g1_i3.p1  ORF type:complete len:436 (-),score=66.14 TRINITY_DN12399_c0_g1_i3:301-1608(-)